MMRASKKAISRHQLHCMLGVTYKSAWFIKHRIRKAMKLGTQTGWIWSRYQDRTVDAEAITRPTMRFVALKRPDQPDLQSLHRARDGLVYQRTAIDQPDAWLALLEYGVACRKGVGAFKLDLVDALGDAENDLTPAFRKLLASLCAYLTELEAHIEQFSQEIEAIADQDDVAWRLMTIPSIGPLAATALVAAVGDGRQFKRGYDLSAWLGLVR